MIYDDAALADFATQSRLRDFAFPAQTRFDLSRSPDFSALRHLQFLRFDGSALPHGLLPALAQLPMLRRLDLKNCRFDKTDFQTFCHTAQSPKLTDLWLQSTDIDDADLSAIGRIGGLQWLILTGTQISDEGLPALLNLRQLRTLWLDETRVSRDGVLNLAQLPHLSIVAKMPELKADFFAAHIAHHKSPRAVEPQAREAAHKILLEFLQAMKDWENGVYRESSAIRQKFAAARTQSHVMAPGEFGEEKALLQRAATRKAAIVEQFCTPQLLAKGVASVGSYGNPPQFDPASESWIDVEQKSANHLIFYALSKDNRWRRFAMKRRNHQWRLDAVQVHYGKWQRDFY